MTVIVAGTDDHDIAAAIDAEDFDVTCVDVANRSALEEAEIQDADVFVLTEVQQATAIPVAKELNEDLRLVVYADGSLPDFARGQADLLVDPALLDTTTVAEELHA
jgi:Trk K+ transport system NAD-binding subunit